MDNSQLTNRVTRISLVANLGLLGIKLGAGLLSRSTAMIADAVHSASDTGATLAVMVGLKVAQRPADKTHPYGHVKAEAVAAKIVAIILTVTGFGLAWESWHILREGRSVVPGTLALLAAIVAIGVKVVLYQYVNKRAIRLKSSALAADAANHKSDILSSAAALLGIVGAKLGYAFLDPVAGIIVGGLILKMAWAIYKRSVLELMDTAPEEQVVSHINTAAANTPGVIVVNDTKARLHGPGILVDMRLCVDGGITVSEGHAIAQQVVENIHQAEEDVSEVLVHVNPCTPTDNQLACGNCSEDLAENPMSLT